MVNFIKQLFTRRGHAKPASSVLVNWAGASGKEYPFTIYPINATFRSVPGNFIYAKKAEDGSWIPIYIAQTRDLNQRLEGHVSVADAIENGATHVHVHHDSAGQSARCTEERDLISRWQPVCNEPLES